MIEVTRTLTRQLGELDYRRRQPYVIQLVPGGRLIKIKVKGERTWYVVTVKQLFQMGVNNRAADLRAQKQARREERRKERRGQA